MTGLKCSKRQRFRLLFLFFLLLPHLGVAASGSAVPRHVLALYDAGKYPDPFYTPLHQGLEFALNHLGLVVDYHPMQEPLPLHTDMSSYVGTLVWKAFPEQAVQDPSGYCRWLVDEMSQGRRVVVLEYLGVEKNKKKEYPVECLNVFKKIGLEYQGEFADDPLFLEITSKEDNVVEYERRLDFMDQLLYSLFKPVKPDVISYLTMRRLDMEDSNSSLVVTSPRGGYVHPSYVMRTSVGLDRRQLYLNPFIYFQAAFGLGGAPVPDVTTINGRRIFYTHIDGDGIFNVSNIDRKSFSAQVILDNVLRRYSHLPFTVGLITGYFDKNQYQGEHIRELYRNMLSLPNVEVASHGYAHPLNWEKGTYAVEIGGYHYSPRYEVQGSVAKLTALLKDLAIPKPVSLFQWTGNCLPNPEHIGYAEQANLLNINGGDSRYDHVMDSHAYLAPLSRSVEGHRQIYSSFSNENI